MSGTKWISLYYYIFSKHICCCDIEFSKIHESLIAKPYSYFSYLNFVCREKEFFKKDKKKKEKIPQIIPKRIYVSVCMAMFLY